MERTVSEESWRRNGPVGPSLEVIDDDDDDYGVTFDMTVLKTIMLCFIM
jgi:hypothetical protein